MFIIVLLFLIIESYFLYKLYKYYNTLTDILFDISRVQQDTDFYDDETVMWYDLDE